MEMQAVNHCASRCQPLSARVGQVDQLPDTRLGKGQVDHADAVDLAFDRLSHSRGEVPDLTIDPPRRKVPHKPGDRLVDAVCTVGSVRADVSDSHAAEEDFRGE